MINYISERKGNISFNKTLVICCCIIKREHIIKKVLQRFSNISTRSNFLNMTLQWRSQDLKILQAYGRASAEGASCLCASAIGASVSRGVRGHAPPGNF